MLQRAKISPSDPQDRPRTVRLWRLCRNRVCTSTTPQTTANTALTPASSLYNIDEFSPSKFLVIHLPPLPESANGVKQLPEFLHGWPVASINYRWTTERLNAASQEDDEFLNTADWPVPMHDVAFAYQWIAEALMPPDNGRGSIYVYGSHLGAGLAMSLSLTESHPHKPFCVRGVATYNGIYNWTMFLPGHKVLGAKSVRDAMRAMRRANGNVRLDSLHQKLVSLFQEPANLFDPFASPSLFFHNPGLPIPESFYASAEFAGVVSAMKGEKAETSATPRRSYLVFPPRTSTLKIPETMLLHDTPSPSPLHQHSPETKTKASSKAHDTRHTFMAQADEMASLMRRSIARVELKERARWDEDVQFLAEEPERRINVVEVGQEQDREELGLNDAGQRVVSDWLGKLNTIRRCL
ncbi:hypothetical protein THARTR1_09061 [Trichoderma harzianum]|uniref:Alpha/beta hydrolase fold-3 domain-containing protein n=1 Tax=Trichoderma harzianum TaxID=5544 RepID=A0A2K0TXF9_TRIHA|nr:hypothetical protein THARTR1_09061 [Trichoderma harzianum]